MEPESVRLKVFRDFCTEVHGTFAPLYTPGIERHGGTGSRLVFGMAMQQRFAIVLCIDKRATAAPGSVSLSGYRSA